MSLPLLWPVEPSTFTKYKLSDTDVMAGYKLPAATIAVLTNLQVTIAEEKLALEFTPNDVLSFTQQEAFKAGQLAIIAHILQEAEVAYQTELEEAIQTRNQQE